MDESSVKSVTCSAEGGEERRGEAADAGTQGAYRSWSSFFTLDSNNPPRDVTAAFRGRALLS